MRRLWVLFAVVLAVFGCADSHQLVRNAPNSGGKISPGDTIYIAVSRDGVYGAKTYFGSGQMTSQILQSAFLKRVRNVQTAGGAQTFDDSLQAARKANAKYLVFPTILQWEDRATEWSAIPDKVEVKVEVVATSNGQVLESVLIQGKSGIATFGGDHPQDLLPKPITAFVFGLF